MIAQIGRRVGWLVITLWVIVTATFFLIRFAPGGPFDKERDLPREVRRNIEAKYGYDKPLLVQYASYLRNVCLRGDLGLSTKYPNRTVNEIFAASFPASAALGAFALTLALWAGVIVGAIAAAKRNTWADYTSMGVAVVGVSVPNFVLGLLLLMAFSFKVHLFPAAGWGTWRHLALPGVTLAAPFAAYIARLTRAGMIEALSQDYIRTAIAKGAPLRTVVFGHALRNALLPVVSYLGPAAASILTGSVVVEKIFAIPGMGAHFVNGALNRDLTLVLGAVIIYSTLLVGLNLLTDLFYVWLDPRTKL